MTIQKKLEVSFANVIASGSYTNSDFTIYNSMDNKTVEYPCVMVKAGSVDYPNPFLGYQLVTMNVMIAQTAYSTNSTSSLADDVFRTIFEADKTQFNLSGSLTILDILPQGLPERVDDSTDDVWQETMNISVYCLGR